MHDEILLADRAESGALPGVMRPTNNAGGLEGGVTNGEDVRVTAWMKPISTLMKPLRSIDLDTMTSASASIERSDVCAVPAAAVVGEAAMCLVLAGALLEKLGGDSVQELDAAWARLTASLTDRLARRSEPA
jgi:chorismate synthase